MLMHYLDCLVAEIKSFFVYFAVWFVVYSLANYFGFRGPLNIDLITFLPFIGIYILFNSYMRFVDDCDGCDYFD
jgi:hypothetical protein